MGTGTNARVKIRLNAITYTVPEFKDSIESVRFDGASYMDLGFVPTTDLNFEIRADLDESEKNAMAPRLFVVSGNDLSVPDGEITIRWENNIFTINDQPQDISYFTNVDNKMGINLILGALADQGRIDSRRFLGDIYYAKFWDSNGIIMDLMPAKDQDGVTGMYDKVSGKMLYLKQ